MEVYLTDTGKDWILEHHPQGIVWEYDVDKPLRLQGWAAKFIEFTYPGHTLPDTLWVDGQPTIRKAIP